MKSEKSIGRILVQIPPGDRKSGMPHSVEMPAPVNGTMTLASSTSSRRRATAVVTSGAIMVCSLACYSEHDLFRKPVPTFRDHALAATSQGSLLVPAFLACVLDAGFPFRRRHAVLSSALSTYGLDPRRALLDGDGFLFHRLPDQAFGLLAQGLLGHSPSFGSIWCRFLSRTACPRGRFPATGASNRRQHVSL